MTPTERADRLAEIDRQLYGEMPGRDSLWSGWSGDARFLRNELTASDSRSKEMVGLLREAAIFLDAEYGDDGTADVLITRLRAAADMAEGTGL